MNQTNSWSNRDLIHYYETVPTDVFRAYAIRGGIEDGCDINLIFPEIEQTESLIEIGACYGRVLRHLLGKAYKGKIYAIERSKHFFDLLKSQYNTSINLIHSDICTFQAQEKVDAILWMWSDISGFPKEEQLPILQHICSWLKENGILIIETLMHTQASLNATRTEDQSYSIESDYGTLYGYIPSEEEMEAYGVALGFQDRKHVHYFTPTGRERILHYFKKP